MLHLVDEFAHRAQTPPIARDVLLLVTPVLPLSLILCTLAVVASRRRRQDAPHGFRVVDQAFFTVAVAGDILAVVGMAAVIFFLYVA